jgi:hypothetical protein
MEFLDYMRVLTKEKAAYNEYNYAAANLENKQIKKRLAEIKSQHEPLSSLIDVKLSERDRLYAAAFYVVIGRMPESVKTTHNKDCAVPQSEIVSPKCQYNMDSCVSEGSEQCKKCFPEHYASTY